MNAKPDTTTQVGSTVAALLEQVPEPLRIRLAGAIAADHIHIYGTGLRHAADNAFGAVEAELARTARQPCRPFCANHITTAGDGELCNGETVTLDFDRPDLPAGSPTSATLTLGYSDDEGDNVTIGLAGSETVYMAAGDFRALATAGLKLVGDTNGGAR